MSDEKLQYLQRITRLYLSPAEWLIYVFRYKLSKSKWEICDVTQRKYTTIVKQLGRVERILKIYAQLFFYQEKMPEINEYLKKNCSKREIYILKSIEKRKRKEELAKSLNISYGSLANYTSRLFGRLLVFDKLPEYVIDYLRLLKRLSRYPRQK